MTFSPIHPFSLRQGIIWLLLAIVAEIPPVVSLYNFNSVLSFRSYPFYVTGIHYFELKWYPSLA